MKQVQNKCMVVSAAAHGLLVAVLLIGSAFRSDQPRDAGRGLARQGESPLVTLVPFPAQPEPMRSEAIVPQPAVAQPILPQSPPQQNTALRADPEPMPAAGTGKGRSPHISTNLVSRSSSRRSGGAVNNGSSFSNTRGQQIQRALDGMLQGLSGSTAVGMPSGGGGGTGDPVYAQFVREAYVQSWNPGEAQASSEATAKVKVTIARNGKVLSARIVDLSGDSRLDRSVQRALERVTQIRPFEEEAKDAERTYTINFNLKMAGLSGY